MNKYLLIGILIPLPIFVIGYLMITSNNQNITQSTPLKLNADSQQSNSNRQQPEIDRDTITTTMTKQNKNTQPNIENFEKKKYTVEMTTSVGNITLELDGDKTPITVNNFITLAKSGFYDNVIFHRTIANFMIQGGDPTGTGTGGPGYKFDDEKFDGEYTRGTLAMANSGPNTNGSQFFIMHADVQLQKDYVIFGRVTSGIETVDKIATAPTGPSDRPIDPVKIVKIEVK